MKYKKDAIDKANLTIQLFIDGGLSSHEEAKKAAIVAVDLMLRVGVYPGYESLWRRTLNFLLKTDIIPEETKNLEEAKG